MLRTGEGKTLGQVAYDAYRQFSDGKSLASGHPIPEWAGLSEQIKLAWGVAADAIRKTVERGNAY